MIITNQDKLVRAIVDKLFDMGKNPLYLLTKVGGGNHGTFRNNFLKRQGKYEKSYLKVLIPLFKSIAEEVKGKVKRNPNNPKLWTFNIKDRKKQLKTVEKKMIDEVLFKEGQIGIDIVFDKPEQFPQAKNAAEIGISFDIKDERAMQAAIDRTNRISTVLDTYNEKLRMNIMYGINEGLAMEKIAATIVDFVENRSITTSLMIARTETIWASNAGAEFGYMQSGVVEGKMWLGGQVGICDICADMEGLTAPLGGSFDVSAIMDKYGITFDYTAGEMPFPPLHPNCRCTIIPITKMYSGVGKPTKLEGILQSGRATSSTKEGFASGVNTTKRVTIRGNGEVAFKPIEGEQQFLLNIIGKNGTMADRERLAYTISKEMGLKNVPTTVLRKIENQLGSAQHWIDDATVAGNLKVSDMSTYMRMKGDYHQAKMNIFDALIYNSDRHSGNYLIGEKSFFYIDNGASLPSKLAKSMDAWKQSQLQQMNYKVNHYLKKADVREYITAIKKVRKSEVITKEFINAGLADEYKYMIDRADILIDELGKALKYVEGI